MCVVRTSNIHCPSNFKHAVQALLTIVTMPYIIRSPELMHLITESWYPLTSIFPFLPPFSLWQPPFYFDFFRFHIEVRLCNICLSLFSFFFSLSRMGVPSTLFRMARFSYFLWLSYISLLVSVQTDYLFIGECLGFHIWAVMNNDTMNIMVQLCLWDTDFISLRYVPRSVSAGSYTSLNLVFTTLKKIIFTPILPQMYYQLFKSKQLI